MQPSKSQVIEVVSVPRPAQKQTVVAVKTVQQRPKRRKQQKLQGQIAAPNPKSQLTSAPAALGGRLSTFFEVKTSKRGPGSIRIIGRDFVGSFTWATGLSNGSSLFNALLNPGDNIFQGTRLNAYAQMYEKFLFNDFTLTCEPSTGTGTAGTYLLAYDRDVSDSTPSADINGLKTYFAMMGTCSANAWERNSIRCPKADPQSFYYCNQNVAGTEERLVYQGQLYGAQISAVTSAASLNMWMDYDIELFDPTLESVSNSEGAIGLAATTSVATTNGGFNDLVGATLFPTSSLANFKTDTAGNSYISLPSGTWLVEQVMAGVGAAMTASAPSIKSNLANQVGSFLNLNSFPATASGQTNYRLDRITVPSGGAILYATLGAATTIANHYVRVIKGAANWA